MDEKQRQRERQIAAGQWLRAARERKGFATLAQFAKKLGIDSSQLSRYELGTSAVSSERAEQIAAALDMNIIEVRRGLQLWVPDEAPGRREPPTDEELRRSGLKPETAEAIIRMRKRIARWIAEGDETLIRQGDRLTEAIDEERDAG